MRTYEFRITFSNGDIQTVKEIGFSSGWALIKLLGELDKIIGRTEITEIKTVGWV